MPDISMCPGEGCDRRLSCYRHMATPTEYRQAWMPTPEIVGDFCEHFLPVYRKAPPAPPSTKGEE